MIRYVSVYMFTWRGNGIRSMVLIAADSMSLAVEYMNQYHESWEYTGETLVKYSTSFPPDEFKATSVLTF